MDNQFQILLKAVLDASGIGTKDIARIQKVIDQYKINLNADIDTNNLLGQVKSTLSNIEKKTGIKIPIDDNGILNAIKQTDKLADSMARVRERSEQAKKSDEKRQEIAQNTSANRVLEQEYIQRQKLVQSIDEQALKIRQLQADGSIQLSFDKVEAQYNKLDKLGLLTDNLKENFAQLKQSFNSFDPSGKCENAIADYGKLNSQLKTVKNSMDSIAATAPKAVKEISDLKRITFENQVKSWIRLNSNAKEHIKQLEQMLPLIHSIDSAGFYDLENKYKELTSDAKAAGVMGKSLGDTFKNSTRKFGEWLAASGGIMTVINGIKNMWNGVVELDTALVDLKKTTNATDTELKNFYYTSNDTAKQLGVTTSEIINATSAWSRLGYGIKDATTLAKNSAILASISPDMNIDQATDGLVSSLKAFKLEAEDSLDGIISKINIIGKMYADVA